jgi:hypothetical protein
VAGYLARGSAGWPVASAAMDTTELEAAYRHLIETAREETFRPPADAGEWPAELHIAHVIATDRLLSAATALVLAGSPARYDNAAAAEVAYLAEIGRAAANHDSLVATMRQCGLELVLLARRLDEQQAATPVPTRIVDGDVIRVDAPLPWSGVLNTHAQVHLREHASALQALR